MVWLLGESSQADKTSLQPQESQRVQPKAITRQAERREAASARFPAGDLLPQSRLSHHLLTRVLLVLNLKIRWEFHGEGYNLWKLLLPIYGQFWLAQPHRSASHGKDVLLSLLISQPSQAGLYLPLKSSYKQATLLLQTGRDECALGKPSAWLAADEQPP